MRASFFCVVVADPVAAVANRLRSALIKLLASGKDNPALAFRKRQTSRFTILCSLGPVSPQSQQAVPQGGLLLRETPLPLHARRPAPLLQRPCPDNAPPVLRLLPDHPFFPRARPDSRAHGRRVGRDQSTGRSLPVEHSHPDRPHRGPRVVGAAKSWTRDPAGRQRGVRERRAGGVGAEPERAGRARCERARCERGRRGRPDRERRTPEGRQRDLRAVAGRALRAVEGSLAEGRELGAANVANGGGRVGVIHAPG